jgi:hypothetical protein
MGDNISLVSETDSPEEVQAALNAGATGAAREEPDAQADTRQDRATDDASRETDTEPVDPPYINIPPPLPAPKLDDVNEDGDPLFKNYEEYLAAHGEWVMAEGARRLEVRQVAARTQEAIHAKHVKAVTAFKRTHTDFDAALQGAKPAVTELIEEFGPNALGVIDRYTTSDADNGPAIVYHLAQHPEELKRIARLPPALQLAALGKLDAVVAGAGSRRRPATAAARPSGYSDPDVIGSDDYAAWKAQRNKEERARRG